MSESSLPLLGEWISASEEQTLAFGRQLGDACEGGEVFLLDGALGAGKTCLANGIAQGMDIDQPTISPTYVIMRSYDSPRGLVLHHLDFYRLASDDDLETIGYEDCFADDTVILAEWPGRCPSSFGEFTLAIRLEALDDDRRRVGLYGGNLPMGAALADSVSARQ